ncbi:MAG: radical SAM protein, partial [Parvularculaceae bacterium]
AINLTRRCNLACAHCYLDAETLKRSAPDELTTEEVCALLDAVVERSDETMIVLTGGEPLVRPDIETIISHGAGLGLATVVGTNGTLLTDRRVLSLKKAGALGVGISLDSLDAEIHDDFRGKPGSWRRTMNGIDACRRHDLSFQIHFTITERTVDEIDAVIDFSKSAGARVLNVFFLICTGRAESVTDLTPERYEEALQHLVEAQELNPDLIIRPRCAPHVKRIAHQLAPDSPMNRISGRQGDGCIAATHYCRVTPNGGVTACPYIAEEVGNIRIRAFFDIWDNAPEFVALREPKLEGACGACEYRRLCGGCRARPLAAGEGLMGADRLCGYAPRGDETIEPLAEFDLAEIAWSSDAATRLSHVPSFLRGLVRRRAEAYVASLSESEVTTRHLSELTARRFGAGGPRHPGATE